MRLRRWWLLAILFAAAGPLQAEYFVLRNGQRISVTSYERRGDTYRLQVQGGFIEIRAGDVVAIEPQEVFPPPPAPLKEKGPYGELIQEASQRHSVDADLITSVIAVESNFNPQAISRRNARGLMQLLPETAARLGVKNVFDPKENIDAGTRYLRELLQRYDNDIVLALAAYNAGPERVEEFGRVPPFRETQSYVRRVKRAYDEKKSQPHVSKEANPAKRPERPAPGGAPL